jgi:UBX domain-containing protein 1
MAGDNEPTQPNTNPAQQPAPGGGRTLDGTYVPPPAGASSSSASQQASSSRQPAQRGLRTLKDLQSGGGGSGAGGHAHGDGDHSDDDDAQDDENQDFFTGGEKSGLAVQNPNAANPRDQINNILKRARQ